MNKLVLSEELDLIVKVLLEKYCLKYIFLIGSRSKGSNDADSDFDIVAFCNPKDFRLSFDYFYINNNFIDLDIYTEEMLDDINNFVQMRPEFIDAIRLYGDQDKIELIFKKVKEVYNKGPQVYEEDKIATIEWLKRITSRLKNEQLDILYNYKFQRYSLFLLSTYFRIRGLWFHCPKTAFRWLEENDFESYKAFKKIYKSSSDINNLGHLVELIVMRERD
jgi:predicted nucleotidyltransferase